MSELKIRPGDVVDLRPGDRKWAQEPMRLRVTAVRHDLSRYYDGLVWLEGDELSGDGVAVRWTQELVRLAALG